MTTETKKPRKRRAKTTPKATPEAVQPEAPDESSSDAAPVVEETTPPAEEKPAVYVKESDKSLDDRMAEMQSMMGSVATAVQGLAETVQTQGEQFEQRINDVARQSATMPKAMSTKDRVRATRGLTEPGATGSSQAAVDLAHPDTAAKFKPDDVIEINPETILDKDKIAAYKGKYGVILAPMYVKNNGPMKGQWKYKVEFPSETDGEPGIGKDALCEKEMVLVKAA